MKPCLIFHILRQAETPKKPKPSAILLIIYKGRQIARNFLLKNLNNLLIRRIIPDFKCFSLSDCRNRAVYILCEISSYCKEFFRFSEKY